MLSSVNKKTLIFWEVTVRRRQEQGLEVLKTKEFTFVSDCFQNFRNAVIDVFLQSLIMTMHMKALIMVLLFVGTHLFVCNAQEQEEKIDDETLLLLYDGLRVADVSDGMDMVGLRDLGIMDQKIQALERY